MQNKAPTCIWYESGAEDAARFYAEIIAIPMKPPAPSRQ